MRVKRAALIAYVSIGAIIPAQHIIACSAITVSLRDVIDRSELIVRAQPVQESAKADEEGGGTVTLKILETIKGVTESKSIQVPGRFANYLDRSNKDVPYQQLNCSRAAGCGGCYAYDYKMGNQYLLFLKDGTPYWAPLSPTNEDISGKNDPWFIWVKKETRRLTSH